MTGTTSRKTKFWSLPFWIGFVVLIGSSATWWLFRPANLATPEAVAPAAEWIGRAHEVANNALELCGELRSDLRRGAPPDSSLGPSFAQIRFRTTDLKAAIAAQANAWIPRAAVTELLDSVDALVQLGEQGFQSAANVDTGPLELAMQTVQQNQTEASQQLARVMEAVLKMRANLLGLPPGDWLFGYCLLAGGSLLVLWLVHTQEPADSPWDQVIRNASAAIRADKSHGVRRCHQMALQIMEMAQSAGWGEVGANSSALPVTAGVPPERDPMTPVDIPVAIPVDLANPAGESIQAVQTTTVDSETDDAHPDAPPQAPPGTNHE